MPTMTNLMDPIMNFVDTYIVNNVLCADGLKNKDDHNTRRPFALIDCKFCGHKVLRREMELHHTQCPSFPMTCDRCHKRNIPRRKLSNHWARTCPMTKTECSLCSATMLRKDIPNHQDSQCPEKVIMCPFTGCGMSLKRKEMDEHINSSTGAHSKMLQSQLTNVLNAMKQIQDSNQQLRDELKRERRNSAASIEKLYKLEREKKEMAEFIRNLHDSNQSLTGLNEQAICLMISDDSESC